MKTTRIISIANQKGGVGKTTTCVNLAAAFVEQGRRVLLIDNDPQANLTSYLNVAGETPAADKSSCDELYLSKRRLTLDYALDRFVRHYQFGLDFIGSSTDLAGVEYYLYTRGDREHVLRNNLEWARGEYDFILVDNPPSINLLTLNALTAADQVLIPVQTEFFSMEGIVKMQDSIKLVRDRWNPRLTIAGILPTQVDARKKLTSEVLDMLARYFPEELLESRIRDNSKLAESTGHGKTIFKYAPTSHGAEDYRALADEVGLA